MTSFTLAIANERIGCCALAAIIGASEMAWAATRSEMREYIQSHSVLEFHDGGLPIDWPKLDHKAEADKKIAITFVAKCGLEHTRLRHLGQGPETKVYLAMILQMRRAGGYLNAVLEDTLYRVALTDLASELVQHPERATEITARLETLRPGPWGTIGVGHLIGEHFSNPALEGEFSKWPEAEILGRVSKLFGTNTLFFSPATSSLIESSTPHDLIHRTAETQWMLSYAIPAVLGYLKHGGELRDLDGRDATNFLVLMGRDIMRYQFPMYGVRFLDASAIITLRDSFGNADAEPKFLKSTMN